MGARHDQGTTAALLGERRGRRVTTHACAARSVRGEVWEGGAAMGGPTVHVWGSAPLGVRAQGVPRRQGTVWRPTSRGTSYRALERRVPEHFGLAYFD
jgi:hypothetical protein